MQQQMSAQIIFFTSARLTLISETAIFLCLLLCSEVLLVFVFIDFHENKLLRRITIGAFHSTKNSGNSGFGSEWNRHFPEFHSEILGVPREVGLKFRKIGITGKFRSIRPFLLAPSFSEPGNRTQHGFQFFCSISVFRLLLCDR